MKMNKYVKATGIGLLGAAAAGLLGAEAYESFQFGNAYDMLGENFDSVVNYAKSGVTALGSLTSAYLSGNESARALKNKEPKESDLEKTLE